MVDATSQKRTGFDWSPISYEAAQLLAVGELSVGDIAEKLGVTRQTLWNWRRNAEFAAHLDGLVEEIKAEIRRHGIGVIERRIAYLGDRHRRLRRIIEERGEAMKDVPGGSTGLLVRKVKSIGFGEGAREVEEYAVDTGLLSEIRELEKQSAQELGQWINRSDVNQTLKSYETGNAPDDL